MTMRPDKLAGKSVNQEKALCPAAVFIDNCPFRPRCDGQKREFSLLEKMIHIEVRVSYFLLCVHKFVRNQQAIHVLPYSNASRGVRDIETHNGVNRIDAGGPQQDLQAAGVSRAGSAAAQGRRAYDNAVASEANSIGSRQPTHSIGKEGVEGPQGGYQNGNDRQPQQDFKTPLRSTERLQLIFQKRNPCCRPMAGAQYSFIVQPGQPLVSPCRLQARASRRRMTREMR